MLKSRNLNVLIAPLDWGLGHATRCIPIIKSLISHGHTVTIASGGMQKKLLQQEFPLLQCVDIPGYTVQYASRKFLFLAKILLQVPKILIQIKRENRWLKGYLRLNETHLIISDNRFGLFSKQVYSVFITHQLYINTSLAGTISRILTSFNYKLINRFTTCWIPDFEKDSLAGKLSHPENYRLYLYAILDSFRDLNHSPLQTIENSLTIIISGPEPQRSLFEQKLFAQLKTHDGRVTVLRGLPGNVESVFVAPNVTVHNHLESAQMNRIICESAFVVARAGYSTIMDLIQLGKKSILIPTPGQPEQESLAKYLFEKKIILAVTEDVFDLRESIEAAKKFDFMIPMKHESSLEETISELREIIK